MNDRQEDQDQRRHLDELGDLIRTDGRDQPDQKRRACQRGIGVRGIEKPRVVKPDASRLDPLPRRRKVIRQRIIANQRRAALRIDQSAKVPKHEEQAGDENESLESWRGRLARAFV